MSHFSTLVGAPPTPPTHELLVYFRANKEGVFPRLPTQLPHPGEAWWLVIARINSIEGTEREWEIRDAPGLWAAIDGMVNMAITEGPTRVWTIHANAMLGRCIRWRARSAGVSQVPVCFLPPVLTDLVDAVNAPAILSANERYGFRLVDYIHLLGLKPVPGMGEETGYLIDLIRRYGS